MPFIYGTRFGDELSGTAGNDFLVPGAGADTLDGGQGSDSVEYYYAKILLPPTLWNGSAIDVDLERSVQIGGFAEGDVLTSIENVNGTDDSDVIKGNNDANQLFGAGANDTLEGRGGNDFLFGDDDPTGALFGSGADGDDHLDGGSGDDELSGQGGDDTLIGGLDQDKLFGDIGNDILDGGNGDDQLFGGDGNDILFGDPGLDRLDGGAGTDTANYANAAAGVSIFLNSGIGFGDAGGDVFISIENVIGTLSADTLVGSNVANVLEGRAGDDTLDGRGGADTLNGFAGLDTATYATSAAGVVVDLTAGTGTGGDAQGDTLISIENLIGSNSVDALYGSASANTLDGRGGADLLIGRGGNDIYIVDNPSDAVVESAGQGTDEVRANTNYTLATNQEIETLRTVDENSTVGFNLNGNNLANQIVGNAGDNALFGDAGADILIGARGVDIMRGGSGADTFVWRIENESSTQVAAMDLVVDFDPLAGDLIDLSGIDANVFAAGNQSFTFIGAAGFSGTPGEINFVQQNGETIIQIQTGVVVDIEMGIRIAGLVTPDASWFVF